jgi:ADP-heptose:LPS heptosyltransferase
MTNKGLSKVAFHLLDRLTDIFPSIVPVFFQKTFQTLLGNGVVYSLYLAKYRHILKKAKAFDTILVVSDVNIGDAIMLQQSLDVLRQYFPFSRIDYLCNQTGGELVSELPAADHVFKVFKGAGIPTKNDLAMINDIVKSTNYSVIINYCPFIANAALDTKAIIVRMYVPLASHIIRRWKQQNGQRHISDATHTLLKNLLSPIISSRHIHNSVKEARSASAFKGNSIYLTQNAIQEAKDFLARHNILHDKQLLFFNPDATSRYTRMPLSLQIEILQNVLSSKLIDAVLLGMSYSQTSEEQIIISAIPKPLQKKIVIVPHLPVSVYAALIDACTMFLSSDTGPVHIAASWKVSLSKSETLKNSTSVITVFGSGDSKMYGYDSQRKDHVPANQSAPSKVFVARAPCRNITCVNKWGKSCKEVRCFHGLEAEEITGYVLSYFRQVRSREYARSAETITNPAAYRKTAN